METVVEALRYYETLSSIWHLVVWLSAAFLLMNGATVFVSPATANRFLEGYARSPQINVLEAALRFVAGVGFMGASPDMKLSPLFFLFGAVLTITAVPMMFLYGPHKRYATWAIAFAKRILSLYGLMSLALGGLVVWALV
jgi:uncharacterized protein YjeT (DUF2065 family)